jgi:hypothetical protein
MDLRSLFIIICAAALIPRPGQAADTTNMPFEVLSEGVTTCGEYIAEPAARGVRTAWVVGYITGRNREAASPRDRLIGTSFDRPESVVGWLLSYCQTHSLDPLVRAADDLRADFLKHEQGR